jgi:hypothetical protein
LYNLGFFVLALAMNGILKKISSHHARDKQSEKNGMTF